MFGAPSRFAGAGALYRDVDVAARVEGATPHGLIVIMFEELLNSLDTLRTLEGSGQRLRGAPALSRALSILHGLESSLDFVNGGEIAVNLAKIYREARRLMIENGPERAKGLDEARKMLVSVSGAWTAIG